MANTPGKKATAGPTGTAKARGTAARKPKKAPKAAPAPAEAGAGGDALAEPVAGTLAQAGAVTAETIVVDAPVQTAATIVTEPAIEPVAPNPAAPAAPTAAATAAPGRPGQGAPEAASPTYRPAPAPWALIVGLGGLVWATLIGLMVVGIATPGTITFNPAWLLVALGVLIVGFGIAGLVSSQRRRA